MIAAARQTSLVTCLGISIITGSATACEVVLTEPVLQLAYPAAKSAAFYLQIDNPCPGEDRLIAIDSTLAMMSELHETRENDQGVVSMIPIKSGLKIPPESTMRLEPGGRHGMLMGLNFPVGTDTIDVELTFETSGPMTVNAPIRFLRK